MNHFDPLQPRRSGRHRRAMRAARRSRQCGKLRYPDHRAAVLALHSAAAARVLEGPASRRHERRTYRCPTCHGWHLTSREARS